MKDVYPQATITPFRATQDMTFSYRVEVDGSQPQMWANIGNYDTPADAIASFTPPMRPEYQLKAMQALRDRRKVTFSLDGALSL